MSKGSAGSQTLSRGIQVLEALADTGEAMTIDAVATRLGVHRSVAYRLVRTLEDHRLISRNSSGHLILGARLASLAAGVSHDVRAAALPELTAVANELGMTCFVAVMDRDECVTLTSVEPRHTVASVVQRPGARHSMAVGAPSKAILSRLAPGDWPVEASAELRAEVAEAAARGFATSHDEVIPSLQSVAVPLELGTTSQRAAIAVVHLAGPEETAAIAARLRAAAETVRAALG